MPIARENDKPFCGRIKRFCFVAYRLRQYYESKVLNNTEATKFPTVNCSFKTYHLDITCKIKNVFAFFDIFGAKIVQLFTRKSKSSEFLRNRHLDHFASKLTKITIFKEIRTLIVKCTIDQF